MCSSQALQVHLTVLLAKLLLLRLPYQLSCYPPSTPASERDPRDPAPEFVWNSWLRQPLLELGLYDHCPALLQVGQWTELGCGCCAVVCI